MVSGDALAGEECEWRSAPVPEDMHAPLCDLGFREVTRLGGDMDGVIPVDPVMVLRDGRYATSTYSRGEIALWAPDGRFLDVLGNGPGQGPGEFGWASSLAQVEDEELLVFTGRAIVHRYSTRGRFLRSVPLTTIGGAGWAVTYGGAAITSTRTLDGIRGIQLRGDSTRELGILGRPESIVLLAAAEDIGVWSAEIDRYVLRRHVMPSAAVEDSLVPARDWFPGPEGNETLLSYLHADGRGLIWTFVRVADPDAPTRRRPADREMFGEDIEELMAVADRFGDTVIEAFAPDGKLVASVRIDSAWDAPRPIHGNIWYRPARDMVSLIILEAVLMGRG